MLRVLGTLLACAAAVVSIAPESAARPTNARPTTAARSAAAVAHAKRHAARRLRKRCRPAKRHAKHRRRLNRCIAARLRTHAAAAKRRRRAPKAQTAKAASASKKPTTNQRPAPISPGTTAAPAPTAIAASPPGPVAASAWPVANHIETWALDDCGQGSSTAPTLTRQWVSYAEANCGPGWDAKALSDCHAGGTTYCNAIQYLDTDWIYQSGSPPWNAFHAAAGESWYQHTPGSTTNRVMSNSYGGGYLINQSNPAVQSFFQSYVRSNYPSEDGLMMDDQSPGLNIQLYYSSCGCSSTNEVASSAALRATHGTMSAAMTHASGQPYLQIDNTLPANPYLPQGLDMLNQTTGVHGLLKEGSPEYNGALDPYYSTLLDEVAYVADNTNGFVVTLSYGDAGASYQQQSRRVQEATMLLGYSPGRLVDWADLEQTNHNLAVWPEEGIYPTGPVQSMGSPGGSGCLAGTGSVCATGGHNDVQVAPGVYRREFTTCYVQGTPFGQCAGIVNTTSSAVTVSASWLTQSYGHQISFNGGDIQSGGTVDLTSSGFTPGVTTLGAKDAILLAP